MVDFFVTYWATIVVSLILAAIVALVIFQMYKDKKAGKSSCGGKCANCPGHCHQSRQTQNP